MVFLSKNLYCKGEFLYRSGLATVAKVLTEVVKFSQFLGRNCSSVSGYGLHEVRQVHVTRCGLGQSQTVPLKQANKMETPIPIQKAYHAVHRLCK